MANRNILLVMPLLAALGLAGCDNAEESSDAQGGSPMTETAPETLPDAVGAAERDAAEAPAPAPAGPLPPAGGDGAAIVPEPVAGSYASEEIVLVLNADGSFRMSDIADLSSIEGAYEFRDGAIAFFDVTGNLEGAEFPMQCDLTRAGDDGFGLAARGESCAALDGQVFRPAT